MVEELETTNVKCVIRVSCFSASLNDTKKKHMLKSNFLATGVHYSFHQKDYFWSTKNGLISEESQNVRHVERNSKT